jgi:hypothetical protein
MRGCGIVIATPLVVSDFRIVDAGQPMMHEAIFVKFPELDAIRPERLADVVPSAADERGTITPYRIWRVRQRHAFGVTRVSGVLRHLDTSRGALQIEGRPDRNAGRCRRSVSRRQVAWMTRFVDGCHIVATASAATRTIGKSTRVRAIWLK